jgi:hypothetical protein
MSPNAGEGGCGVSANEYSCAHGAQINFGDVTPYLIYAGYLLAYPDEAAGNALAGPLIG